MRYLLALYRPLPLMAKIINDPVYGFISVPAGLLSELIAHPYVQRLRRIRQLGLTDYVYPGALHTRFHHALGAMHLMGRTLDILRRKGQDISPEEQEAAQAAILLHDIGHGPFSHALEHTILEGVPHEYLSSLLMRALDHELGGRLRLAVDMFDDRYERHFFHQLISSQLDMDRLDYLQRDCFFTGVAEGNIGLDRIIHMLDVVQDQVVVEMKGVYSIENFLHARRLMYWQVYLHKTTVSTEQMLIQVIRRAKELTRAGVEVPATPALGLLLREKANRTGFLSDSRFLKAFAALDDFDVWGGVKYWAGHDDPVLSRISQMLLERRLFRAELSMERLPQARWAEMRDRIQTAWGLSEEQTGYFCTQGSISNAGYLAGKQPILVRLKNGQVVQLAEALDIPDLDGLSRIVTKYFICYARIS